MKIRNSTAKMVKALYTCQDHFNIQTNIRVCIFFEKHYTRTISNITVGFSKVISEVNEFDELRSAGYELVLTAGN